MFNGNTVSWLADRICMLSYQFREAIDTNQMDVAARVSAEATPLLSEVARILRNAEDHQVVKLPSDKIGLLWESASQDFKSWKASYKPTFESYANSVFKPLDLREALNKLLHSQETDYKVSSAYHELLLFGYRYPYQSEDRRMPWIAVLSVEALVAVLSNNPTIAQLNREHP